MTDDPSSPTLSDDLRDLLRTERARPTASSAMQERVLTRLASSGASGGHDESPPSTGEPGDPAHGKTAPTQPPLATQPSVLARISRRPWTLAFASFVAGVAAGGILVASVSPRSVAAVSPAPNRADVIAPPSAAPAATSGSPVVDVHSLPRAAASVGVHAFAPGTVVVSPPLLSASGDATHAGPADGGERDDALGKERVTVEMARAALGRGDAAAALEAVARHARDYPNGRLVEEREAIAVQALVRAGSREAALARAAQFERTYPKSMLLPVVIAAITTIP